MFTVYTTTPSIATNIRNITDNAYFKDDLFFTSNGLRNLRCAGNLINQYHICNKY